MPKNPLAERFAKIKAEEPIPLDRIGSWPDSVHVFDERTLWAVRAAITAQRPLLITGEPGSGKSQLARAAAQVAGRALLTKVVDARTESRDLQYHFDAVARLGEAQALAFQKHQLCEPDDAAKNDHADTKTDPMNPLCFLKPEVLWWAFEWHSAEKQAASCRIKAKAPETPKDWKPAHGCVLLIDEIDKAEQDLPNGLLETLGNGAFSVPYLDKPIGLEKDPAAENYQPPPLVFITSNGERELPAAFVRRCMVLHLDLKKDETELVNWLVDRGKVHQPQMDPTLLKDIATMMWTDRQDAQRKGLAAPGQAEYLDILKCLAALSEDPVDQGKALEHIREFAFAKARRV